VTLLASPAHTTLCHIYFSTCLSCAQARLKEAAVLVAAKIFELRARHNDGDDELPQRNLNMAH